MNTVGALIATPFRDRVLAEKREIVRLGPHKPVITISYRTKGGNPAYLLILAVIQVKHLQTTFSSQEIG